MSLVCSPVVLKSSVMFSKGLYMALLFLEYVNNTLGRGGMSAVNNFCMQLILQRESENDQEIPQSVQHMAI